MTEPAGQAEPETRQPSPFERFTRAILAVPPKELARERAKYERGGDHRRKKPEPPPRVGK